MRRPASGAESGCHQFDGRRPVAGVGWLQASGALALLRRLRIPAARGVFAAIRIPGGSLDDIRSIDLCVLSSGSGATRGLIGALLSQLFDVNGQWLPGVLPFSKRADAQFATARGLPGNGGIGVGQFWPKAAAGPGVAGRPVNNLGMAWDAQQEQGNNASDSGFATHLSRVSLANVLGYAANVLIREAGVLLPAEPGLPVRE